MHMFGVICGYFMANPFRGPSFVSMGSRDSSQASYLKAASVTAWPDLAKPNNSNHLLSKICRH